MADDILDAPDPAAAVPAADVSAPVRQKFAIVSGGEPRDLPRLMTRIFDTPLLVAKPKMDVIMAALGPRLGFGPNGVPIGAFFDNEDGDEDNEDGDDPDAPYDLTADGVAVISVDGSLVYKSSWLGALSGLTGYGDVRGAFDAAMVDDGVKGILLCIDSYGGEANGCFDLSDAIFAARNVKPVYAVAADDAYSAAYALLSAASKVFVSRTSGVGSIGVIALHVDQSAADKMNGLSYSYITAGAHKADGNPHQPLTEPALESIQAEVDRLRGIFAASVAKYRGMSVDAVLATEAACFHGELAVAAGLADQVGTPDDAMAALVADLAKERAPREHTFDPARLPASAAPAEVVDLSAMREKLRGELVSDHGEIIELCRLANRDDMAAEFVRSGASLAVVREKLQTLRADVSDARTTRGHIAPDAGINRTQQIKDGWEHAHAQAMGIRKEK